MRRSFRFDPPEPRPVVVSRPRLLRSLAGRWQHRVTSVVGGPGLGKTTLLAQAIAENRLMPRGDDVWVGVEDHDADAGRLAHVVATAVVRQGEDHDVVHGIDRDVEADRVRTAADDPRVIAEAVWQRAPIPLARARSVGDLLWLGEQLRRPGAGGEEAGAVVLTGRGDVDHAQAVAHRVLRVDPWSEAAYARLVGAALARNDRSSARRLLDRCMEALADLGVDPSPSTRQLQHRLLAA